MQQRAHQGAELVNEIGCRTWNNLMTRDLDAAKRFYGEVFGWTAVTNDEVPEYWEVYFLVEDLDRAIELTKAEGGQIMVGPLELPIARIAAGMDPQGAVVSLMQPDYPEPR